MFPRPCFANSIAVVFEMFQEPCDFEMNIALVTPGCKELFLLQVALWWFWGIDKKTNDPFASGWTETKEGLHWKIGRQLYRGI